jgi:hypothetical protein
VDTTTPPDARVLDGVAIEINHEGRIDGLIRVDENVREEALDVGGVREHVSGDVAEHRLGVA